MLLKEVLRFLFYFTFVLIFIYLYLISFLWFIRQRKSSTNVANMMSSLTVWQAGSPICPSAGLVGLCVRWVEKGAQNQQSKASNKSPPCLQEPWAPCAPASGQGCYCGAHLTTAPPVTSPLWAAPQVSSLCPSGWRRGQRSGRKKAPVSRTNGRLAVVMQRI